MGKSYASQYANFGKLTEMLLFSEILSHFVKVF